MVVKPINKSFSKKFLRAVSSLLLAAFVCQDLGYANPEIKLSLPSISGAFMGLDIPESVARVEEIYRPRTADGGPQSKTIYLIQDAHTNASAQINISRTLEILLEKEKISTVYLEGGFGDVSLNDLKAKASLEKRKQVGMKYLRKGELSGAEYLNLTHGADFSLRGVEDETLYWKSLEVYRRVAKDRERSKDYLTKIRRAADELKPEILNPPLRTFDAHRERFLDGKISWTEYFTELDRRMGWFGIGYGKYPEVERLKDLKKKEAAIDFVKANQDAASALKTLSKEKLKDLEEASSGHRADKFSPSAQKTATAYYQALEMSLREAADDIAFSAYPHLFQYFSYLREADKLDPAKLIQEQRTLENEIAAFLTENDDEKRLLWISKALRDLESMLDLTLLPDDQRAMEENPDAYLAQEITGFLNQRIMDLEEHYDRVMFLDKDFDEAVKNSKAFYRLTKERDEKFVAALLGMMEKSGESKAALVTGGYHSPNLKELLKAKNVSFVSVTPQVVNETNTARYEKLLLGQARPQTTDSRQQATGTTTLSLIALGSRLTGSFILTKSALGAELADAPSAVLAPPSRSQSKEDVTGARLSALSQEAIEEALKGYGIEVINRQAVLSFRLSGQDWSMNELRAPQSKLIAAQLKEMPTANLLYPLEILPTLPSDGSSSKLYLGIAKVENRERPVVVKIFSFAPNVESAVLDALINAQIRGRLGIGPDVYGVIRDSSERVLGYAMDPVIGRVERPGEEDGEFDPDHPDVLEIRRRLEAVGMVPGRDYIKTPNGRFLAIDEDMTVIDKDLYAYYLESRTVSGARLAGAEPNLWAGREEFLNEIRKIVNPENAGGVGWLVNSGANMRNSFGATNADTLILSDGLVFGDKIPERSAAERSTLFRNLITRHSAGEKTLQYWVEEKGSNLREQLFMYLESMGVRAEDVKIRNIGGDDWEIDFSWAHPYESVSRARKIFFLGSRKTESLKPADLPREVASAIQENGGLDFFLEQAPYYYKEMLNYLPWGKAQATGEINNVNGLKKDLLKAGGYLIGDDENSSSINWLLKWFDSWVGTDLSSNSILTRTSSDFGWIKLPKALRRREWRTAWGNGSLELLRRERGGFNESVFYGEKPMSSEGARLAMTPEEARDLLDAYMKLKLGEITKEKEKHDYHRPLVKYYNTDSNITGSEDIMKRINEQHAYLNPKPAQDFISTPSISINRPQDNKWQEAYNNFVSSNYDHLYQKKSLFQRWAELRRWQQNLAVFLIFAGGILAVYGVYLFATLPSGPDLGRAPPAAEKKVYESMPLKYNRTKIEIVPNSTSYYVLELAKPSLEALRKSDQITVEFDGAATLQEAKIGVVSEFNQARFITEFPENHRLNNSKDGKKSMVVVDLKKITSEKIDLNKAQSLKIVIRSDKEPKAVSVRQEKKPVDPLSPKGARLADIPVSFGSKVKKVSITHRDRKVILSLIREHSDFLKEAFQKIHETELRFDDVEKIYAVLMSEDGEYKRIFRVFFESKKDKTQTNREIVIKILRRADERRSWPRFDEERLSVVEKSISQLKEFDRRSFPKYGGNIFIPEIDGEGQILVYAVEFNPGLTLEKVLESSKELETPLIIREIAKTFLEDWLAWKKQKTLLDPHFKNFMLHPSGHWQIIDLDTVMTWEDIKNFYGFSDNANIEAFIVAVLFRYYSQLSDMTAIYEGIREAVGEDSWRDFFEKALSGLSAITAQMSLGVGTEMDMRTSLNGPVIDLPASIGAYLTEGYKNYKPVAGARLADGSSASVSGYAISEKLDISDAYLRNHLFDPFARLKEKNSRKLSPEENSDVIDWLRTSRAFPTDGILIKIFINLVYLKKRNDKQALSFWSKALSEKWGLSEQHIQFLVDWLNKRIQLQEVSERSFGIFINQYLAGYQEYPVLKKRFMYVPRKDVTEDRKLELAAENMLMIERIFGKEFASGTTFYKVSLPDSDYFMAMRFGLGESSYGAEILLGIEQGTTNPMAGVFFRIGLDTEGTSMRFVRVGGVREKNGEISKFWNTYQLSPEKILMISALKIASDTGLSGPVIGVHSDHLPEFTGSSLSYKKIYNQFGITQRHPLGFQRPLAEVEDRWAVKYDAMSENAKIVMDTAKGFFSAENKADYFVRPSMSGEATGSRLASKEADVNPKYYNRRSFLALFGLSAVGAVSAVGYQWGWFSRIADLFRSQKTDWTDLEPKTGLEGAKQIVHTAGEWLEKNGYSYPGVLERYEQALAVASDSPSNPILSKFYEKETNSYRLYINSEKLIKLFRQVRGTQDESLFVQMIVSVLVSEAWGLRYVESLIERQTPEKFREAVLSDLGRLLSQSNPPSEERVKEFFVKLLTGEFIEMRMQAEFMNWVSAEKGLYLQPKADSAAKRVKSEDFRSLYEFHRQIFGYRDSARDLFNQILKSLMTRFQEMSQKGQRNEFSLIYARYIRPRIEVFERDQAPLKDEVIVRRLAEDLKYAEILQTSDSEIALLKRSASSGARLAASWNWGRWVPGGMRERISELIESGVQVSGYSVTNASSVSVKYAGNEPKGDVFAALLENDESRLEYMSYPSRVGRKYLYQAPAPDETRNQKKDSMLKVLRLRPKFKDFVAEIRKEWATNDSAKRNLAFRRLSAVYHQQMSTEYGWELILKEERQFYKVTLNLRDGSVLNFDLLIRDDGRAAIRPQGDGWKILRGEPLAAGKDAQSVLIRQAQHIQESEEVAYALRYEGYINRLKALAEELEGALFITNPDKAIKTLDEIGSGFSLARSPKGKTKYRVKEQILERIAAAKSVVSQKSPAEAVKSIEAVSAQIQTEIDRLRGIAQNTERRKTELRRERPSGARLSGNENDNALRDLTEERIRAYGDHLFQQIDKGEILHTQKYDELRAQGGTILSEASEDPESLMSIFVMLTGVKASLDRASRRNQGIRQIVGELLDSPELKGARLAGRLEEKDLYSFLRQMKDQALKKVREEGLKVSDARLYRYETQKGGPSQEIKIDLPSEEDEVSWELSFGIENIGTKYEFTFIELRRHTRYQQEIVYASNGHRSKLGSMLSIALDRYREREGESLTFSKEELASRLETIVRQELYPIDLEQLRLAMIEVTRAKGWLKAGDLWSDLIFHANPQGYTIDNRSENLITTARLAFLFAGDRAFKIKGGKVYVDRLSQQDINDIRSLAPYIESAISSIETMTPGLFVEQFLVRDRAFQPDSRTVELTRAFMDRARYLAGLESPVFVKPEYAIQSGARLAASKESIAKLIIRDMVAPEGKRKIYEKHILDAIKLAKNSDESLQTAYQLALWGAEIETILTALFYNTYLTGQAAFISAISKIDKSYQKPVQERLEALEEMMKIYFVPFVDDSRDIPNYMNLLTQLSKDHEGMMLYLALKIHTIPVIKQEDVSETLSRKDFQNADLYKKIMMIGKAQNADEKIKKYLEYLVLYSLAEKRGYFPSKRLERALEKKKNNSPRHWRIAEDIRNKAFGHFFPEEEKLISSQVDEFLGGRKKTEKFLQRQARSLQRYLKEKLGYDAHVKSRVKSSAAIWEKLYFQRGEGGRTVKILRSLSDLSDLMGFRIVTDRYIEVFDIVWKWLEKNRSGEDKQNLFIIPKEKPADPKERYQGIHLDAKINFNAASGEKNFETMVLSRSGMQSYVSGGTPVWSKEGNVARFSNTVNRVLKMLGMVEQDFRTIPVLTGDPKVDFDKQNEKLKDHIYVIVYRLENTGEIRAMDIVELPSRSNHFDLVCVLQKFKTNYKGFLKAAIGNGFKGPNIVLGGHQAFTAQLSTGSSLVLQDDFDGSVIRKIKDALWKNDLKKEAIKVAEASSNYQTLNAQLFYDWAKMSEKDYVNHKQLGQKILKNALGDITKNRTLKRHFDSYARDIGISEQYLYFALGLGYLNANDLYEYINENKDSEFLPVIRLDDVVPRRNRANYKRSGARLSEQSPTKGELTAEIRGVVEAFSLANLGEIPSWIIEKYFAPWGEVAKGVKIKEPKTFYYNPSSANGYSAVTQSIREWDSEDLEDVYRQGMKKVLEAAAYALYERRSNGDQNEDPIYQERVRAVQKVYAFAFVMHQFFPKKPENAVRKSGGGTIPYIVHPVDMAVSLAIEFLANAGRADAPINAEMLIAALLHDTLEDTLLGDFSDEEIEGMLNLPTIKAEGRGIKSVDMKKVMGWVRLMTRRDDEKDDDPKYFLRLIRSLDPSFNQPDRLKSPEVQDYFRVIFLEFADKLSFRHDLDLVPDELLNPNRPDGLPKEDHEAAAAEDQARRTVKYFRNRRQFVKYFANFAYRTLNQGIVDAAMYWMEQFDAIYNIQIDRIKELYPNDDFWKEESAGPARVVKKAGDVWEVNNSTYRTVDVMDEKREPMSDEDFKAFWRMIREAYPPVVDPPMTMSANWLRDPAIFRQYLQDRKSHQMVGVALLDEFDHVIGGYLISLETSWKAAESLKTLLAITVDENYRGVGATHVLLADFLYNLNPDIEAARKTIIEMNVLPSRTSRFDKKDQAEQQRSQYSPRRGTDGFWLTPAANLESTLGMAPVEIEIVKGPQGSRLSEAISLIDQPSIPEGDRGILKNLLSDGRLLDVVKSKAAGVFGSAIAQAELRSVVPIGNAGTHEGWTADFQQKTFFDRDYSVYRLKYSLSLEDGTQGQEWSVVVRWPDSEGRFGETYEAMKMAQNSGKGTDAEKEFADFKEESTAKLQALWEKSGGYEGLPEFYAFIRLESGLPVILEEFALTEGDLFSEWLAAETGKTSLNEQIDQVVWVPNITRTDAARKRVSTITRTYTGIYLRTGDMVRDLRMDNVKLDRTGERAVIVDRSQIQANAAADAFLEEVFTSDYVNFFGKKHLARAVYLGLEEETRRASVLSGEESARIKDLYLALGNRIQDWGLGAVKTAQLGDAVRPRVETWAENSGSSQRKAFIKIGGDQKRELDSPETLRRLLEGIVKVSVSPWGEKSLVEVGPERTVLDYRDNEALAEVLSKFFNNPLNELRSKPVSKMILVDLDNTAALKDSEGDRPISDAMLEKWVEYLELGGEIGVLSTRAEENIRTRIRYEEILTRVSAGSKERLKIYGRFGLSDMIALGKVPQFTLTKDTLENSIRDTARNFTGWGEPLEVFETAEIDPIRNKRNPDMEKYKIGKKIALFAEAEDKEPYFAIISFPGTEGRDKDGKIREAFGRQLVRFLGERYGDQAKDIEFTVGGETSINITVINKSNLVELLLDTRSDLKPEEVIFADDEGRETGTGFRALNLSGSRGITGILVGEPDPKLSTKVIRSSTKGPDALLEVFDIEIEKRRSAGSRLSGGLALPDFRYAENQIAGEFLKVLELDKAEVIDSLQDNERPDIHVYRVRVAGTKEAPAQISGNGILYQHLGRNKTNEFYLVFSGRSELTGIFPILPNNEEAAYYDLTDYNVPIEVVRRAAGADADARAKVEEWKVRIADDKKALRDFAGRFGYKDPLKKYGYHAPYAFGRIQTRTGKVEAMETGLEAFSLEDGEEGVLFPVFPSVYHPAFYSLTDDREFYQRVYKEARAMSFEEGDNLLDTATGSGFVAWIAWVAAGRDKTRDSLNFHAYDLNPLAAATADVFLRQIVQIPSAKVKRAGSLDAFGETKYRFISGGSPAYDGETAPQAETLEALWDHGSAGRDYWKDLSRNLRHRLKIDLDEGEDPSLGVFWNSYTLTPSYDAIPDLFKYKGWQVEVLTEKNSPSRTYLIRYQGVRLSERSEDARSAVSDGQQRAQGFLYGAYPAFMSMQTPSALIALTGYGPAVLSYQVLGPNIVLMDGDKEVAGARLSGISLWKAARSAQTASRREFQGVVSSIQRSNKLLSEKLPVDETRQLQGAIEINLGQIKGQIEAQSTDPKNFEDVARLLFEIFAADRGNYYLSGIPDEQMPLIDELSIKYKDRANVYLAKPANVAIVKVHFVDAYDAKVDLEKNELAVQAYGFGSGLPDLRAALRLAEEIAHLVSGHMVDGAIPAEGAARQKLEKDLGESRAAEVITLFSGLKKRPHGSELLAYLLAALDGNKAEFFIIKPFRIFVELREAINAAKSVDMSA